MNIQIKAFNELSVNELYELLYLRNLVFVIEQNCVYLDTDKKDDLAHHILIYDEDDELAAYARTFKAGIKYETCSIGRVVVSPKHRGTQVGHLLMEHAVKAVENLYGTGIITISAQAHLQRFYSKHGFETVSDEYLEDNIPHVEMIRKKEH